MVERDDALDQSADSRRNLTLRSRENGVGVWCVRPIIKIHEQKVLFDWTMALTQNTGPLSVWRKTSVRVCQRRNTGPANSVVREHRTLLCLLGQLQLPLASGDDRGDGSDASNDG